MTDVDAAEIEFQCPRCGNDLKQTIAQLKVEKHMTHSAGRPPSDAILCFWPAANLNKEPSTHVRSWRPPNLRRRPRLRWQRSEDNSVGQLRRQTWRFQSHGECYLWR